MTTPPGTDPPETVAAVVLARLRAAVDPVYDGEVPTDDRGQPLVQRYGVLYADPGSRTADDLSGTVASRHVHRWQVTSVGEDRTQCEWVAVRCRDALLDGLLALPGWQLTPVRHDTSAPIRPDRDLPGKTLFVAIDTYSLTATR